ncbi:MAG: diacylglycerol kinase family protein [Desulfobacterales bacterium]
MTTSTGPRIAGIVNSKTTLGKARTHLEQLVAALRARSPFKQTELHFTSFPGHAVDLTRKALAEGADVILSIGGDGTHSDVVNGFFDGDGRLVRPRAGLAVLHSGTGGDFRKSLGIGASAGEAIRSLVAGTPRPIDIGLIRFRDANGRRKQRYFVNIASFGISGAVDDFARLFAPLGGKTAFLLATVRAFRHYRNVTMRIEMDNGLTAEQPVCVLAVANGRFFGGGMKIAPQALLDDGFFDAVCLGDLKFRDFLMKGHRVYRGSHLSLAKVWMRRVRRVSVQAAEPVPIDIDGEARGYAPAEITVAPERIPVWVA